MKEENRRCEVEIEREKKGKSPREWLGKTFPEGTLLWRIQIREQEDHGNIPRVYLDFMVLYGGYNVAICFTGHTIVWLMSTTAPFMPFWCSFGSTLE